jgi:hypothetical protein
MGDPSDCEFDREISDFFTVTDFLDTHGHVVQYHSRLRLDRFHLRHWTDTTHPDHMVDLVIPTGRVVTREGTAYNSGFPTIRFSLPTDERGPLPNYQQIWLKQGTFLPHENQVVIKPGELEDGRVREVKRHSHLLSYASYLVEHYGDRLRLFDQP